MLLLGRIILGIGIGLSRYYLECVLGKHLLADARPELVNLTCFFFLYSMAVPVYISEACPAPLRGRMTLINQAFLTGGQFAASIVCGIFSYAEEGWRLEEYLFITIITK